MRHHPYVRHGKIAQNKSSKTMDEVKTFPRVVHDVMNELILIDGLFDMLSDHIKSRIERAMKDQGITDLRLLIGNKEYVTTFLDSIFDKDCIVKTVLHRRLMESTEIPRDQPSTPTTPTLDAPTTPTLDAPATPTLDAPAYYQQGESQGHWIKQHFKINKIRTLGYREDGTIDDGAPYICLKSTDDHPDRPILQDTKDNKNFFVYLAKMKKDEPALDFIERYKAETTKKSITNIAQNLLSLHRSIQASQYS